MSLELLFLFFLFGVFFFFLGESQVVSILSFFFFFFLFVGFHCLIIYSRWSWRWWGGDGLGCRVVSTRYFTINSQICVFVCVSGSNLNLAAGQASASTHANGTETNDSGKMACQLNAGEME